MEGEVILFYGCNILQCNETWVEAPTAEATDRVGVSLICWFGIPCMCDVYHVCTLLRVVTDGKGLTQ